MLKWSLSRRVLVRTRSRERGAERAEWDRGRCWVCPSCLWVKQVSVQFSLITQLCPALCDPVDCSTPGFPVHHQLLELVQTHVHRVSDAIKPSVIPFSHFQSFPASESFQMSHFFTSGGQSIRVSALASVLPMSIQD